MARDANFYEDVVNIVSERVNRLIDEVAPLVMGGSTPPFTQRLKSDDEIYDFYSKLSPQEAQQRWQGLDEQERERLSRIMNSRQQGPQQREY